MATLARPIWSQIPGTGFSSVPSTVRHRAQLCLTGYCWLGIARLGLLYNMGTFPTSCSVPCPCMGPGWSLQQSPEMSPHHKEVTRSPCSVGGWETFVKQPQPALFRSTAKTGLCESLGLFLGWLGLVWGLEPGNSPVKSLQRGGTAAGPTSTKPAAKNPPAAADRGQSTQIWVANQSQSPP